MTSADETQPQEEALPSEVEASEKEEEEPPADGVASEALSPEETDSEPVAAEPSAKDSEPTAPVEALPPALVQQEPGWIPSAGAVVVPIVVSEPRRGDLSRSIMIALLGAVAFAAVSIVGEAIVLAITDGRGLFTNELGSYLLSSSWYLPVLGFGLAFVGLAALARGRGRWAFVLGSLAVAAIVYLVEIGAALIGARAWSLQPAETARFLGQLWLHPLVVVPTLLAREVAMWFGLWIAAGKRRSG